MGLDIYAGTLTRYYTHNWKTVVQQFAEANGLNFRAVRAQESDLSPQELQDIAIEWRDAIIKGLNLKSDILWNEDYDETPYYTDKPDWDAISALSHFYGVIMVL